MAYVTSGDTKSLASMLESDGSLVNVFRESDGMTPAHIACQNADLEMLKLLHSHQCNLNATDFLVRTPLFYSLRSLDVMKFLFEHSNIDIEHKDQNQRTIFYHACCDYKCGA